MLLGVGDRIRQAIKGTFPNVKVFSEATGMPYPSLRNYLTEEKKPGAEALAIISAATGYSIDWLVTGKEKTKSSNQLSTTDIVLLTQIIEAVETCLGTQRKKMPPSKKARLVGLLYEHCYKYGEIDMTYVNSMVGVAA